MALLLILSVYLMVPHPAYAAGTVQYRAVHAPSSGTDADGVQAVLDQQAAQGWQYVGSVNVVMIFKK
jgi:hypothetical protein